MKKMRILAMLLCAMLLVPMATHAEAGEKLFDEPKTFSLFLNGYWHTTLMDENFNDTISVALRERTNVTLDIDMVRVDNDDSQLNMIVASGELPDMIHDYGKMRSQLIQDGYILPLDDLIEEYGPNIKQNFGHVLDDWREPDGHIYGLGCFVWNDPKYALNLSVNTLYMRYDILKALGYEKLDRTNEFDSYITMDEYIALMDKVREEYPDMIPALFDAGQALEVLATAKGNLYCDIPGSATASYEDGRAVSRYSSQYIPEYIEQLNKLYTGGYVPADMATMTQEQTQALIANGQVFSTLGNTKGLEEAQAPLGELGEDCRMVMFYLRDSEDITELYINNYAEAEPANLLITTSCKYPEDVIKYLDFCASYEGSTLICAGVEGITYNIDENGFMVPIQETVDGYASWDTNMIKKYGIGSWLNLLPSLEGLAPNGQAFDINAEAVFTSDRWVMYNNTDYRHFAYPKLLSSVGQLNTDDLWEASDAFSRIDAYFNDRIANAVFSDSLDDAMAEWEVCKAQMEADGLAKLDEQVADAWIKLADYYGRDPEHLIATVAER